MAPAVEYVSTSPLQGAALPLITPGVAGSPITGSVLSGLLPHAFTPCKEINPLMKLFGKSIETELRFPGVKIVAPPVIFQA